MPRFEVHADLYHVYTIGMPSDGPLKWAPGEIVPQIADVPDELRQRYEAIMGEFWAIQAELKRCFDAGVPADGTRKA